MVPYLDRRSSGDPQCGEYAVMFEDGVGELDTKLQKELIAFKQLANVFYTRGLRQLKGRARRWLEFKERHMTIEVTVNEEQVTSTVERCKERGIIIPTFAQMRDPSLIPESVIRRLKDIDLWAVDSLNLFRINWRNDHLSGGYKGVNVMEIPREITGVKARIFGLVGKYFPTGAHKVGATFGCLAPRLVTGTFDPTSQKAVWPSTGNYCRGGAYIATLLACDSVAILPEEMSQERFEWLEQIGSEIFATPGCESNVKEIYDKCWELKAERGDKVVVFNQFDEFGNGLWHYTVTADAILEVLGQVMGAGDRFAGFCSATGSAGTIAAGDRLKEHFPSSVIAASEALQCPTLLMNGFGGHRIEGIGDKHIPWIHNVRNTDLIVAIDDEDCMRLMRLFNEPAGRDYLVEQGASRDVVDKLDLLGISSISNLLTAVKVAKWYELDEQDILFTMFTDSMELYGSRMDEARQAGGDYDRAMARADHYRHLLGVKTDTMAQLTYPDQKRVHNLKYFTWIEQQGRELDELNAQWHDWREYWPRQWRMADRYDELIQRFNERTGLLAKME